MIDAMYNGGLNLIGAAWWTGAAWPVIWAMIKIVAVLAPLMGAASCWAGSKCVTAPTAWAPWACCSQLPMRSSC